MALIVISAYRALIERPADRSNTFMGIVAGSLFLLYLVFDLFEERIRKRFRFFSRLDVKCIRLVVNDERTEVYGFEGNKVYSTANQLVLRTGKKGRRLLAVGAPEDWLSSPRQDLPADAVHTDLVAEAFPGAPCIDEKWQAFIRYCELMGCKKEGVGYWRQFFRRRRSPLKVDLQITDPHKREFIAGILLKSKYLRPLEVLTR